MTTEELKKLGLTDEMIQGVFAIRGREVEEEKEKREALNSELTTVKAERDSLKEQRDAANQKIEEFGEIDVDGLKQKVEDYKDQAKELEDQMNARLKKANLEHQIDIALAESGARNRKTVLPLLDMDVLEHSNDLSRDLKSQIDGLKASDETSFLFQDDKQKQINPVSKTGGSNEPKDLSEMDYFELSDYLRKHPEKVQDLNL